MPTMEPLLSWPQVLFGLAAAFIVLSIASELIRRRYEKSPQDAPTSSERPASVSQQAIQNYYNTRRGA